MTEPAADLTRDAVPGIPRGVRLHEDAVRGRMVLLAPERVIELDPIGLAVLQQIDGRRSLGDIIDRLAALYDAPAAQIAQDVTSYIGGLCDRRILDLSS
jgi:pyrroloquinoline quinone biosynthesis protein D